MSRDFALRRLHGLSGRLYDCARRSFQVHSVAVQHETAMKNCVTVHLFDRVVRYFREAFRGPLQETARTTATTQASRGRTWKCLVYEEPFSRVHSVARSRETVEFLRAFGLRDDDRVFAERPDAAGWWRLVPFTYRLGWWFDARGLRSFAAFPVFRPGPKHLSWRCTSCCAQPGKSTTAAWTP